MMHPLAAPVLDMHWPDSVCRYRRADSGEDHRYSKDIDRSGDGGRGEGVDREKKEERRGRINHELRAKDS